MKITLDEARCEAHGECVMAAPEVFDLGEDDAVARVLDASPDEGLRDKVQLAARLCPVTALLVDG
jgi:ferredoxin